MSGRAPRLDPLAVRRQLREAGLKARHSLSQNFLADPDVLQSIVDLAAPGPDRQVLEVGPGLGILTAALLEGGANVTAVELDARLAERLRRLPRGEGDGELRVVGGDILDQAIADLVTPPYEVVANVPYHITSPILHLFLGTPPRPRRLILMLQREVAERIAAAPGDMSYLSVFVQYHARVRIALRVPREAFEPAPDVDSAVVVIEPFEPDEPGARPGARPAGTVADGGSAGEPGSAPEGAARRLSLDEEDGLWRVVQAGFRERRKMLRNVLPRQLPVDQHSVDAALAVAGIAGDRRPQTLSVEEWLSLHKAIGTLPGQRRLSAFERRAREASEGRPAE